jgi:CubicO group peptidase (beta-lactamase class C family)
MTTLRSMGLGVALALAGCAHVAAPPEDPEAERKQLDAIVDAVYDRYRLPGLAVGVVRDGRVIYTRTRGETIVGSGHAITSTTQFKIASNSKAMTSGVLARLVDAGKVRWDDPVVRHIPQFRMHEDWVTREMQVRDLLIHNSGLRSGAGDLMFWPEPNLFTRADIIHGLAYLKPIRSFRSSYDYDNTMYVVAGEVAAGASQVSYEEVLRREVFEPLRLTRCRVGEWRRDEDLAQPHMRQGDGNVPIRTDPEVIPVSNYAAAGGIRCSLDDMTKWVRMWLDPNHADVNGQPWLSKAQADALWTPHMPMPLSQRQRAWDGSHFNAYGYGWRLSDMDGKLRVAHTGTLSGMYSAVTLLPELNTGFVFMINGEGSSARTVLNTALAKHFTSGGGRAVSDYADELKRDEEREKSSATAAPDVSNRSAPSAAAIAGVPGIYRDPWFGEISVCPSGGELEFQSHKSPLMAGTIMQVGSRLLIDWTDDTAADVEAWLDPVPAAEGKPAGLALAKVDPEADFSSDYEDLAFVRERDCP